jgi:hypothetical protein
VCVCCVHTLWVLRPFLLSVDGMVCVLCVFVNETFVCACFARSCSSGMGSCVCVLVHERVCMCVFHLKCTWLLIFLTHSLSLSQEDACTLRAYVFFAQVRWATSLSLCLSQEQACSLHVCACASTGCA